MTQHGGEQEWQQSQGQGWQAQPGQVPPPLPSPGGEGSGIPEIVPVYQPPPAYQGAQVPARREPENKIETYFGETVRTGIYPWAATTQVSTGMSTVKLDLRQILQPGETMEIRLAAWLATVRIAVPAGTEVDLQLGSSVGDARLEVDRSSQEAPRTGARLVVSGWSLMSEVRVRAFGADAKPKGSWRWTRKA